MACRLSWKKTWQVTDGPLRPSSPLPSLSLSLSLTCQAPPAMASAASRGLRLAATGCPAWPCPRATPQPTPQCWINSAAYAVHSGGEQRRRRPFMRVCATACSSARENRLGLPLCCHLAACLAAGVAQAGVVLWPTRGVRPPACVGKSAVKRGLAASAWVRTTISRRHRGRGERPLQYPSLICIRSD